MDNCYYIYIYKDPETNQPFYVGKGKNKRAYENYESSRNMWVYNKINKIIEKGSTMDDIILIVENNLSEKDAYDKEIFYIKKYGKIKDKDGILFNMTDGGDSPPNRKGCKYKMKDEHKKSIIKSWTDERKRKMSDRLKGKTRNEKWGENISFGKRNKIKFDKDIFEKHVRDGLKLKDIWVKMNISYDIIRDRMFIHYDTTDFNIIRKILNVSDDVKMRQHQIDFNLLKSLTLEGMRAKDIIKIFNIKCIKTLSRFISYKYNINSFSKYKKLILAELDQSSSTSNSSSSAKLSSSGVEPYAQ
jgi:hypothetical protein